MRKSIIRTLSAMTVVLILAFLTGCGSTGTEMQTVEWKDFSITVPQALQQQTDPSGPALLYKSDDLLLSVVRDGYDGLREKGYETLTMSLADYASLVSRAQGIRFANDPDGIPCSDYEKTADGKQVYCHCELRRGADAFWIITMECDAKDREKYETLFRGWFNSIEVDPYVPEATETVDMQEVEWKGLCLTVPADWTVSQTTENTCTFTGEDGSVEIFRDSFDDIRGKGYDPDVLSLEEYAFLFAGERDYRLDFDGQLYCDYGESSDYYHFVGCIGGDAFWRIRFACPESERDRYEPLFKIWSKSIVLPAAF